MQVNPYHGQTFYSEDALADLLQVSVHTLRLWRKRRVGLPWHKHYSYSDPYDHPTYLSEVVTT